jgi:hypothetical protein
LPIFDRLLDILDNIPGKISRRTASLFFYAGLATRYESQRLTEDDRDSLTERINRLRPKRFGHWLSEREWIPIMMETVDRPRKLLLKLDVNETNIDYLENASCEEIFAEREHQYQESYRLIPALDELCSRNGRFNEPDDLHNEPRRRGAMAGLARTYDGHQAPHRLTPVLQALSPAALCTARRARWAPHTRLANVDAIARLTRSARIVQ